jgi:hypothetical protein
VVVLVRTVAAMVVLVRIGAGRVSPLPATTTATTIAKATATKTNPSITTLNLRDILDQPDVSLLITITSGAGIGLAL